MPNVRRIFLKPLIAGVCCGASAVGISYVFKLLHLNSKIGTLFAIAVAVVVYVGVLLLSKGISRIDVLMMPKGAKIARAMDKYNLLEK